MYIDLKDNLLKFYKQINILIIRLRQKVVCTFLSFSNLNMKIEEYYYIKINLRRK